MLLERRIPWRIILGVSVVIGPWFIFSALYFGQLFPNTLAAKMAQGRSGVWQIDLPWPFSDLPLFAKGAWLWWRELYSPPIIALASVLIILGLANKRLWKASCLMMMAWAFLHLVAYSILDVPYYHWYYTPIFLGLGVAAGFGVDALERWGRMAGSIAAAAVVLLILWPHFSLVFSMARSSENPKDQAYRTLGCG
jgi:hypothetical protein